MKCKVIIAIIKFRNLVHLIYTRMSTYIIIYYVTELRLNGWTDFDEIVCVCVCLSGSLDGLD